MNNLLRLSIVLASIVLAFTIQGQDEYPMSNTTVTTCSGLFVDDGIENPYSGTGYVMTFCPENAGDAIQLDFLNFQLQASANPNNSDYVVIYQGDTNTGTPLGPYTGSSLSGLSLTANVSNPSGCLTIQLVSPTGNTNANPGWVALISCTTPCSEPAQSSEFLSPAPPVPGIDSISVCIGDLVEFDGSASSAGPGFTLDQYLWNFNDGNVDTISGAFATHQFTQAGEFLVGLTVQDNNGCQSLNLEPLKVIVSTLPDLQIDYPDTICLGETALVNTALDGITWTAAPPLAVAGETYLADDLGFEFVSELTFDFFEPGATLESCDDFIELNINMEHSYLGDLEMQITCPNGTQVLLHEFGSGGGGTYLGEAVDPGAIPGTGYDYGWSPTSTLGFLYEANNQSQVAYTDNGGSNVNQNIVNPGIYESQEDLCDLVGCPLNGTWTFNVTDNLGIDDGYIFSWGIEFDGSLFPGITTFTPIWGQETDSSYWTTSATNVVSTSPNGNDLEIVPDSPGDYEYTFSAFNDFDCQFDTTITIHVTEPYEWEGLPDAVIECEGQTILGAELIGGIDVPDDCTYSLTMSDFWGDGWEGANLEIIVGGVSTNFTLANGVSETVDVPVQNGASIELVFTGGIDPEEAEYYFYDNNGDLLFSDGVFFALPMNGSVFSTIADCSAPGPDFIFEWSPAANLNNPNVQFPVASNIVEETTFIVSIYENGHPDCAVTAEMTIDIAGALTAGDDLSNCSMTYALNGESLGQGEWSGPPEVIFADPMSLTTTVTATTPGVYDITLTDIDGLSCPLSDVISIAFFDGIDIDTTLIQPFCFGDCDGEIEVIGSLGNLLAGDDYIYSFANGTPGATDNEIINLCTGTYTVTVEDSYGCTDEHDIFLPQPPAPVIDSIYRFRESCFGACDGIMEVYTPIVAEYSYDGGDTWVVESSSNEFCAGIYDVFIRDANGCQVSESVVIASPVPPVASFSADPVVTSWLEPNVEFINFSEGNLTNQWFFGQPEPFHLSNDTAPSVQFPNEPGDYLVQLVVTDSIGCQDSTDVTVRILDELQPLIPTAFSPNDDGINDYWEVIVNDLSPLGYEIEVFDRWGNVVFESSEMPTRWNGQGIDTEEYYVPDGVYAWRLRARSASTTKRIDMHGFVTVIR